MVERGDRVSWLESEGNYLWECFGTVVDITNEKALVYQKYRYTQRFHRWQLQALHNEVKIDIEKLTVNVHNDEQNDIYTRKGSTVMSNTNREIQWQTEMETVEVPLPMVELMLKL